MDRWRSTRPKLVTVRHRSTPLMGVRGRGRGKLLWATTIGAEPVSAGSGRRRLWAVGVDRLERAYGGVRWAEVGAVAAEHLDPLRARLVEVVGDEVGGVAVPAAGHADVRRRGAGGLTDEQVRVVDGVALGAVGPWWRRRARRGGWRSQRAASARRTARVRRGSRRRPRRSLCQVSRLATPRSRSLRRVATRSPGLSCSPADVVRVDVSPGSSVPVLVRRSSPDGGVEQADLFAGVGE